VNLAVGGSTEDESSSHPTVKSIENKNIASNNFFMVFFLLIIMVKTSFPTENILYINNLFHPLIV